VRQRVGSHNFIAVPSRSLVHPSNQSVLSVTLAYSPTATLAPPPMFEEPCQAVYGSFANCVDTSPTTASVLSCCRWCTPCSTTATSYLSEFLPIFSDASRPYLTLQLVSSLRPRDRRPRDTPLSASSGTGQLQTGTHGISSTAQYGVRVFESTRSGIRPTKSPPPVFVVYTSATRSAIPSDNHRPSLVSCCSIHSLELIAILPPISTISLHVSTTAKDISLSPVTSLSPTSSFGTALRYCGLRNGYLCHFSHVKNTG